MLYGVRIEEKGSRDLSNIDTLNLGATMVPFSMSASEGVVADNQHIETSSDGQSVTLDFDTATAGEVHLRFKGIDAQVLAGDPNDGIDIYPSFACGDRQVDGMMRYLTEEYQWFEGRHDYVANSRYCEKPITSATITFPKVTHISFDSLEVWHQPLNGFEEAIAELSAEKLENVDFHDIGLSRATSEITGDITVSEPKVLVVTIPKTDGWTAYVDGKEQEILTANIMWMGLELEPGHHDIRFVYHTPGLRLGAAISGVTALGLLIYWIVRRRGTRRKIVEEAGVEHG